VSDFNLSKILSTAQTTSSANTAGGANNPIWLAPEVVEGGQATTASDVFSFGLVLFELLTWALPWGCAPHYRVRCAACLETGSSTAACCAGLEPAAGWWKCVPVFRL
jgi:serine/threonine protein kinase